MKITTEHLINDKYLDSIEERALRKKDRDVIKEIKVLRKEGLDYFKDFDFEIPRLARIPKTNGGRRDIYMYQPKSNLILKLMSEAVSDCFNDEVSDRVYSYRKGTRIFDAVKAVQRDMREGIQFVKLDITNYFVQTERSKVNSLLDYCFAEDELGLKLRSLYNRDKYYYKGSEQEMYLGLMPGNPLSCVISNLFLSELDEVMIQEAHSYARYSDDIIIGFESDEERKRVVDILLDHLEKYNLKINLSKAATYGNEVEFLGLKVTSEYIDIPKNKEKEIKSFIKSYVKRLRKMVELEELTDKQAMYSLVKRYNRYMYKSIVRNDLFLGTAGFIMSNVTTFTAMQDIDFYFINQARYLITGKHNKANIKALSIEQLESIGYKSLCEMYKYFCMDKQIYIHQVHNLL